MEEEKKEKEYLELYERIKDDLTRDLVANGFIRAQREGPYNLPQAPNAGTVILGGGNSGDGVLSVRESLGTEIVKLDNQGMTINAGSMVIKDSGGTTIMDSLGLVSTESFVESGTAVSGNQVVDGTALVDVTDSEFTVVLPRDVTALTLIRANLYLTEPGTHTCSGRVWFNLNGTNQTVIGMDSGNTSLLTLSNHIPQTMASGTNTLKLQTQLADQNGTAFMTINSFRLTNVIVGR